MSVVQDSTAGPPPQRAEDPAVAQEVHQLLERIQSWVNVPRLMQELGVTERHRIPVERLRVEASQLDTMRLQYLARGTNGPTYPQSTGTSVHDEDEPCLLYTSPSPRDGLLSRMPSSA